MFITNRLYNELTQVNKVQCIYTNEVLINYTIDNWEYLSSLINDTDPSHYSIIIDNPITDSNLIKFTYYNSDEIVGIHINYILLYDDNKCVALYQLPSTYNSNNLLFHSLNIILDLTRGQIQFEPDIDANYDYHVSHNDITHRNKFKESSRVKTINELPNPEYNITCNNQTQIENPNKKIYSMSGNFYYKSDNTHSMVGENDKVYLRFVNNDFSNYKPLLSYDGIILKLDDGNYWECTGRYLKRLNIPIGTIDLGVVPDYVDNNIFMVGGTIYKLTVKDIVDIASNSPISYGNGNLGLFSINDMSLFSDYSLNDGYITFMKPLMDAVTGNTYLYKLDSSNNYTFKSKNLDRLLKSLYSINNESQLEISGSGIAGLTEGLVLYSYSQFNPEYNISGYVSSGSGLIIRTPEFEDYTTLKDSPFDKIVILTKNLFLRRDGNVWYVHEIRTKNNTIKTTQLGFHSFDRISLNDLGNPQRFFNNGQPLIFPVNYKGRLLKYDFDLSSYVDNGSNSYLILYRF